MYSGKKDNFVHIYIWYWYAWWTFNYFVFPSRQAPLALIWPLRAPTWTTPYSITWRTFFRRAFVVIFYPFIVFPFLPFLSGFVPIIIPCFRFFEHLFHFDCLSMLFWFSFKHHLFIYFRFFPIFVDFSLLFFRFFFVWAFWACRGSSIRKHSTAKQVRAAKQVCAGQRATTQASRQLARASTSSNIDSSYSSRWCGNEGRNRNLHGLQSL